MTNLNNEKSISQKFNCLNISIEVRNISIEVSNCLN